MSDTIRLWCHTKTLNNTSQIYILVEENHVLQFNYKGTYQIAKGEKPHIIAEDLIKSCTEKMVK